MRALRPSELTAILRELHEQRFAEAYSEQRNHWGFLAAAITNNVSRIIGMFSKRKQKVASPDDFIADEWKKWAAKQEPPKPMNALIEDAKAKGLKGPWG